MQENYSEFKIGNWVVYLPERNYCTIKSLSPKIILEGTLQDFSCSNEDIGKIQITEDKLQVFKFDNQYPKFIRKFNSKIYITVVLLPSNHSEVYFNDGKIDNIQFIHEVQNVYYRITGELLRGNLYGVREG